MQTNTYTHKVLQSTKKDKEWQWLFDVSDDIYNQELERDGKWSHAIKSQGPLLSEVSLKVPPPSNSEP